MKKVFLTVILYFETLAMFFHESKFPIISKMPMGEERYRIHEYDCGFSNCEISYLFRKSFFLAAGYLVLMFPPSDDVWLGSLQEKLAEESCLCRQVFLYGSCGFAPDDSSPLERSWMEKEFYIYIGHRYG